MSEFKNTYEDLKPDKATIDKMYNNILTSSYAPAFRSRKKRIKLTKSTVTKIACACIIVTGVIVSSISAVSLNVHFKSSNDKTPTESTKLVNENSKSDPESTSLNDKEIENTTEDVENTESTDITENTDSTDVTKETSKSTSTSKKTNESNTSSTTKVTVNGQQYIIATTSPTIKHTEDTTENKKDKTVVSTEKASESTTKSTTVTDKKENSETTAVSTTEKIETTIKTSTTMAVTVAVTTKETTVQEDSVEAVVTIPANMMVLELPILASGSSTNTTEATAGSSPDDDSVDGEEMATEPTKSGAYYFSSVTTLSSAGRFIMSMSVNNDTYGSITIVIYQANGYDVSDAIVVYFKELDTYGYYFS